MAHVFMFRFTSEGVKNISKITELRKEGRQKTEELGGKIIADYLLLGPRDVVYIVEGLDDKQAMTLAGFAASSGLLTTETYVAIDSAEGLGLLTQT
ncbi:GYD domain-containing protein [Acidobacteria bacterium AH-259-D05]|nr:GYD domain-containing protein [Acidobacteria bacterium AH-259-D05]